MKLAFARSLSLVSCIFLINCSASDDSNTISRTPAADSSPTVPKATPVPVSWTVYAADSKISGLTEEYAFSSDRKTLKRRLVQKKFDPLFVPEDHDFKAKKDDNGSLLSGKSYTQVEETTCSLDDKGDSLMLASMNRTTCTFDPCITSYQPQGTFAINSQTTEIQIDGRTFKKQESTADTPIVTGQFEQQNPFLLFHTNNEPSNPLTYIKATYEKAGKYDYFVDFHGLPNGEFYLRQTSYDVDSKGKVIVARDDIYQLNSKHFERFASTRENGVLLGFQLYRKLTDGTLSPLSVTTQILMPVFDADPLDFPTQVILDEKPVGKSGDFHYTVRVRTPFPYYEKGSFFTTFDLESETRAHNPETSYVGIGIGPELRPTDNNLVMEGRTTIEQGTKITFNLKITGGYRRFREPIEVAQLRAPVVFPQYHAIRVNCDRTQHGYRIKWSIPDPLKMRVVVPKLGERKTIVSPWQGPTKEFSYEVKDSRFSGIEIKSELFPFNFEFIDVDGEVSKMYVDYYPRNCGLG